MLTPHECKGPHLQGHEEGEWYEGVSVVLFGTEFSAWPIDCAREATVHTTGPRVEVQRPGSKAPCSHHHQS